MPGYFEEDGHRAMLYAEDPDEISFEPQEIWKKTQTETLESYTPKLNST